MLPSVEKLYNYSGLLSIGTLPGSCSCLAATNTPPGAHSKYRGTCWNCSCHIQKHAFKWNLITHVLPLWLYPLYVRCSAHLAVRQSSESSFGLGRLEEFYDGRESRGWQQHSAQRAVGWEQLLQLWRRHSCWKVLHQDHCCAPRGCSLYTPGTWGHSWESLGNSLLFRWFWQNSSRSHHTPGWRSPSWHCWLVETAGSPEQSGSLPKPSSLQHFPLTPAKSKQAFNSVDTKVKPNYFL